MNKKLATLAAALYLTFGSVAACNSDVKNVETKGYPIVNLQLPELCDSNPKLELEGRFAIPIIYCKDSKNNQVVCRYDASFNHAIEPACYVLEKE
jgi:hypothetical protein